MRLTAAVFTLLLASSTAAQDAVLPVVPLPQEIELHTGGFDTDPAGISIRLAARDTAGLTLAVRELEETFALAGKPSSASERVIWLGLPARDAAFRKTASDAGIWPAAQIGDEGYTLLIEPERILVAANTATGLYYGAQTLKQLLRAYRSDGTLPAVKVTDWPDLRYRALMDDISRGPVPTMSFLKEQVRRIAEMKLNMLTYYTEHVVATERHGEFAPAGGALSIAEWRELSDYAVAYHVTLVGSFQSFAHFERILSHPKYNPLGEKDRLLSPVLPGSIALLRDIFEEMVPAFPAPFFNVNSDETFDLGRGASKQRVDSLGKGVVYAEHILRMREVLEELGVRTMMWGDIVLEHPEVLDMLPRDIIMGTWDYSPRESYGPLITPFTEAGFETFVTPGVLNSYRIMPDFRQSLDNIRQFVADGVAHDVLGMINTVWDDGGSALFERDWFGVAYSADQSWHSTPDDDRDFDRRFSRGLYGDPTGAIPRAIWQLLSLGELTPTDGMSESVLWSTLLPDRGRTLHLSLEDWHEVVTRSSAAAVILDEFDPLAYADDVDVYRFTTELYNHMALSRQAVVDAAQAYREASLRQREDPGAARTLLAETLEHLGRTRQDLVALSNGYRTLWLRENRTYALDRVLEMFDARIEAFADTETRVFAALDDFDKGHFLPPPLEVRLAVEEVSGRYFREWLMSGPLPNPQGAGGATADYLEALGGEAVARPSVALEWEYEGQTYRWHRTASSLHAVVDLKEQYPQNSRNVMVYAHGMIDSPRDERVRATLGSDDGIEIFVNGERVFARHGRRTLTLDEDELWLPLKEGRNHLLLKISQGDGDWGFSFQLPDKTVRSNKNRYRIVD